MLVGEWGSSAACGTDVQRCDLFIVFQFCLRCSCLGGLCCCVVAASLLQSLVSHLDGA